MGPENGHQIGLPQAALFHEVVQHLERRDIRQLDPVVVIADELRQKGLERDFFAGRRTVRGIEVFQAPASRSSSSSVSIALGSLGEK